MFFFRAARRAFDVWKRTKTCHRRWRIVDNSMQAKAKPEAQLGARRSQSDEPRRVGCGKSPQVGTHGSIPPHSTIRQRINCRGAIFCARPSMPPPCCIPLSHSALNVRAQNIAPLQDGASLLGSGSITAIPSPVSFAIHGSLASHRRVFFSVEPTFFPRSGFFFGRRGM